MVNKWVRNSAMATHPELGRQGWAKKNRFNKNPSFWNKDYRRGQLTHTTHFTEPELSGPFSQPAMSKSQKKASAKV